MKVKKLQLIFGLVLIGIVVFVLFKADLKNSDKSRYSFFPKDTSNEIKEGSQY